MDGQVSPRLDMGDPGVEIVVSDVAAVAAVNETEGKRCLPRAADFCRLTDQRDNRAFEPGIVHCRSKERKRVHLANARVDNLLIVPLPSSLVLFRPPMVVDTEQQRRALPGNHAKVHRGLAAVAADFEHHSSWCRRCGSAKTDSLDVGHETLCLVGDGQRGPIVGNGHFLVFFFVVGGTARGFACPGFSADDFCPQ